jgi:hypothetical protein
MAGMAQIVLQNPGILLLVPLIWLLIVAFAWRRRFRPFGPFVLRLVIVVLIILALAQPARSLQTVPNVDQQPDERVVLLVDQSASLGPAGQEALRDEAARLGQELGQATVLYFADKTLWVEGPSPAPSSGSVAEAGAAALDPTGSNLAEALALGGELVGLADQPGRLVLLSDGQPTAGDTLTALSKLVQQRVPVDVLVPDESLRRAWQDDQNEVHLVSLAVPPILRLGETFDLETIVHSQDAVSESVLTLTRASDGEILAEDTISLESGLNRFAFSPTAEELGVQTYQAVITVDDDFTAENNVAAAFTQIYSPPQILVVSEEGAQARRFASRLESEGYEAIVSTPTGLPTQISELEPYDGMV